MGVWLSLSNTSVGNLGHFVGLANFTKAWNDSIFQQAFKNTAVYTFWATLFKLALGMWLAILLNRKFRLAYIFVNSQSGIESARDLEGRRVGIMQWDNTAGVWARGALQHYYGVDLKKIHWLAPRPKKEGVAEGIRIEKIESGGDGDRSLDRLLVEGGIDAVIGPNILPSISARDPRTRRLFRDYRSEEQNYFRKTGIFPTSHIVTLKQAFVERHPGALGQRGGRPGVEHRVRGEDVPAPVSHRLRVHQPPGIQDPLAGSRVHLP